MKRVFLLVILFAAGFGTAHFMDGPPRQAQAASMNMSAMGGVDGQMQAAMDRMNASMKAMHMTGDADRDFMLMMVPHHQSAIDMAKIELKSGHRPELKSLARDIIASQGKEIAQMRGWIHSWYAK